MILEVSKLVAPLSTDCKDCSILSLKEMLVIRKIASHMVMPLKLLFYIAKKLSAIFIRITHV